MIYSNKFERGDSYEQGKAEIYEIVEGLFSVWKSMQEKVSGINC